MTRTIYETPSEREARIDREYDPRVKQRSRNRARTKGVRREAMARANQVCEACHFNFWSILVVHHIIPVQFGGSARRFNLIVLCPNCHALVHHYSHYRRPERHEDWTRGLMGSGLTEDQAKRIILVASKEAIVNDDGSIEPHENPWYSTRYVLIDEPKTAGEN